MDNPIQLMEINKSKFTKTDLKIYEILQNNIHEFLQENSITTLSEKYSLSQASITRFCQKIGFSGFNDFKFSLYNYQKKNLIRNASDRPSMLSMYSKLIETMEQSIDVTEIERLAEVIAYSNTVTLTGTTKSFLPAKMLQLILMKLSIPCIAVSTEEEPLVRNYVTKHDTVILFSASSQIKDKGFIYEIVQETKAKMVVITMTEKKSVQDMVDFYIWLPSAQNQSYPFYLENEIIFSVFADFLASFIAQKIEEKKVRL